VVKEAEKSDTARRRRRRRRRVRIFAVNRPGATLSLLVKRDSYLIRENRTYLGNFSIPLSSHNFDLGLQQNLLSIV
jgi:hypothetical protein